MQHEIEDLHETMVANDICLAKMVLQVKQMYQNQTGSSSYDAYQKAVKGLSYTYANKIDLTEDEQAVVAHTITGRLRSIVKLYRVDTDYYNAIYASEYIME